MSTINICMTSFPRRITNCVKVINSILNNSVLPDRVYLTLSHQEFPNWEADLPKDLYQLIMTSNRVILNWVEENHKSMKKVFPVLPYLEDDDIILDIDDDALLPKDFIEARMKDFNDNNKEHPITSNQSRTINMDNYVMSCYSLFTKKMLANWEKFVQKPVLDTCNDDRTYLYLCHLNGYKLVPCTKYCVGKRVNSVVPLETMPHGDYKYEIGPRYDNAVAGIVKNLSGGRPIGQCFGLFREPKEDGGEKQVVQVPKSRPKFVRLDQMTWEPRPAIDPNTQQLFQYNLKKPVRHDVVYVLGKGSKYKNLEIKISITSMLKFCDHWVDNIYVVGENPLIRNPRVHHIYAPDITKSNKDANIIHKIRTAIEKIPKLSSNFLFCSDDIMVTKKTDWEDFAPRYVFEYKQTQAFMDGMKRDCKNNAWDSLLIQTLDRFVGNREHIYFYEPHIFAPINKKLFLKMCNEIDYMHRKNVIIMSLWFNWLNLKNPAKRFDHQSIFTDKVPDFSSLPRHVTFNDRSFSVKAIRDGLIKMVTMDEFKDVQTKVPDQAQMNYHCG